MTKFMKIKNIRTEEIVTLKTKEAQDRFFENRNIKDWVIIEKTKTN